MLLTVLIFTFVLLLGNALKEILPLLISGQVRVGLVAQAAGLLVPFVWVFALPMGMLTATLLVFGRLSADQELTAVRASGISLLSLVTPILLLSLVLCGVSAIVNLQFGPLCRVAYNRIRFNLAVQLTSAHLPEGRFISDFPGHVFYVAKNHNGDLQDVTVLVLKGETNVIQKMHAPRGRMEVDPVNRQLNVTLYEVQFIDLTPGGDRGAMTGSAEEFPFQFRLDSQGPPPRKIDDLTFRQLRRELRDLERRLSLPLAEKGATPEQLRARKREWDQLRKEWLTPVIFHMHRQAAFSFACFGFTLVGIPLGVRVHRRETNIGIAIALLLVAFYYSFILIGQALDTRPEYAPHLIVWLPNLLFQAVGAFLLWRANKGV